MAIENRYELMFFIQCINGNPNGDPDMGNAPRMDPEDMHGYITDVAIKRRIRNYIQTAFEGQDGMSIIMQNATNINKFIAIAKETAGVDFAAKDRLSATKFITVEALDTPEYSAVNFYKNHCDFEFSEVGKLRNQNKIYNGEMPTTQRMYRVVIQSEVIKDE